MKIKEVGKVSGTSEPEIKQNENSDLSAPGFRSSGNSNRIMIYSGLSLIVIAGIVVILYFFVFNKKPDSIVNNNTNQTTSDELKRKELDLKEKELNLKEKELNNKVNDNYNGELAVINDPDGYTNIRSGPGTNYNILGVINRGEEFYAYIDNSNVWWSVKFNGLTGYVHKSRITLIGNNRPNNSNRSSVSGTYPIASERYLSYTDISNLSNYELKIMRNEIFARYGFIFKTNDMKEYFSHQSWYYPRYDDVNNMLTSIEKANIELIKKYEK